MDHHHSHPHGHHHHHHGERREEEEYPPPPPQPFGAPPPPQVFHSSHHGPGPDHGYPGPPPGPDSVPDAFFPHQGGPPPPAFGHPPHAESHGPHHGGFLNDPDYAHKPTFRVYCRAESGKSLALAHGKLMLVPADPSDPSQHWIKDDKFSTRVKDEEGFPSFALVNKATGQALKHATGPTHPVQLIPYNPNGLDESVLWTESKDTGDNYRTIRMVNNIKLNMDAAWSSDKHYGSSIVLWEWKKENNQRWKIVPY